jgi:outer membrane protein, heavy metal efflux system
VCSSDLSDGDNGLVAELGFPLPLWNQNQGNIKKAKFELLKTGNEGKKLWLILETKLSNAYEELMKAYREAEQFKNILLEASSQSSDLALEGYREGKFDYLEVLEAKRTFFEIQEKYIESLVNYHQKQLEIDYLNSQVE